MGVTALEKAQIGKNYGERRLAWVVLGRRISIIPRKYRQNAQGAFL